MLRCLPSFSTRLAATRRWSSSLSYTKSHEWLAKDGKVGISDYAQQALGEVVFIELPAVGAKVKAGDVLGSVESVKAASDIYSPVDGEVVEVNEKLADEPALMNESPEEGGWIARLKVGGGKSSTLMDAGAYAKHCASQ